MLTTIVSLIVAALLEVGGDAAIRYGLLRSAAIAVAAGSAALVAYGFFINTNRVMDFGRLLGVYVAIFYLVSQAVGVVVFGDRPPLPAVVGGALIVTGGLLIQLSAR